MPLDIYDSGSSIPIYDGDGCPITLPKGTRIIDLSDTPMIYGTEGMVLAMKEDLTGVEWVLPGTSGIRFVNLIDTPADYVGAAGKILAVKQTEDGIEYVELPNSAVWGAITGTLGDQTDLQNALNLKLNTTDFAIHATDDSRHLSGHQNDALDGANAPNSSNVFATVNDLIPGTPGPEGDQGEKGDKGDQGPTGAQGIQGVKGDIGSTGNTGSQGPQGIQGTQGIKGDKGDIGDQGLTGDQGATGLTGAEGPKGDDGIQGLKGDIGNTGATGSQGVQGPIGPQGDDGQDGTGVSIIGSDIYATIIAKSGAAGDMWIVTLDHLPEASAGDGMVSDGGGSGAEHWNNVGPIKGDKGETGSQGIQGIQGEQGIQGPIGNTGSTGATGSQGAQGIQGETGLTGDTGSDGVKGDQGIPGNDGATGADSVVPGPQGIKGDKGLTGDIGPIGPIGPQGPIGADGPQGIQGLEGPIGEGVVTGGTAGQVLSKIDASDYNTEWIDVVASEISLVTDEFDGMLSPTDTDVQKALNTIDNYVVTSYPKLDALNTANGFNLLKPETLPIPVWSNAARGFTIKVASGSSDFSFYVNGEIIHKTTDQSIIIPDVTDLYYIYFNNSGALAYTSAFSLAPEVFYEYSIVALIYWNKETQEGIPGYERHGYRMDSRTHHLNHSTFGARYESGLLLAGLVDGEKTFSQVNSGYFWDEDVRHTIPVQSTVETIYRFGAAGAWRIAPATSDIGYKVSGDILYSYNINNGGVWGLSTGNSSNDFYINFFVATGDLQFGSIKRVLAQGAYKSASIAREAISTEKSKIILDGLPTPEFIFIGAVITKRNGDLVPLSDGSLYLNLCEDTSSGSGSSGTSSNLAADIIVDTTNFSHILSSNENDVQKALEVLEQTLAVPGPQGIQGIKGDTGDQGLKGDTGTQGDVGPAGAQGIQGNPGVKGDDGDIGVKGDTGLTGATGADSIVPGPQGDPGTDGDDGSQGIQGIQGETGLTGAQGVKGDDGDDSTVPGPQGDTGNTGATGATGPGVVTGGSAGQVLAKINATNYNTEWVNAGSGGASDLDDLTDVTITSPSATQVLTYDGSIWKNQAATGGSGSPYIEIVTSAVSYNTANQDSDSGKMVYMTAGTTVTLDSTGLTVGFQQQLLNSTGSAITASSAETIEGFNTDIAEGYYIYYTLVSAGVWSITVGAQAGLDGAPGADGAGVPSGGATDQLLTKIDATDNNTEWRDAPSGSTGLEFLNNKNYGLVGANASKTVGEYSVDIQPDLTKTAGATGSNSVAIGREAHSPGNYDISIGFKSNANYYYSIAIGKLASTDGLKSDAIAIGSDSSGYGNSSVAIGKSAEADNGAVAIGDSAEGAGFEGISIGHSAVTNKGITLGATSSSLFTNSIAVGYGATTSIANQIAIGSNVVPDSVDIAVSLGAYEGMGEGNGPFLIWQDGSATLERPSLDIISSKGAKSIVTKGYVERNGVTGSRPTSPTTGMFYFDTTLTKPIWYSGSNWVDATGTTV